MLKMKKSTIIIGILILLSAAVYGATTYYVKDTGFNLPGGVFDGNVSYDNNSINNLKSILFDTSESTPPDIEGYIGWNYDDMTLDIVTGIGNVIQVGQELTNPTKNGDTVALNNGQVVSLIGSSGDRGVVRRADASNTAIATRLGVVTKRDGCVVSSDCPITTFGRVRGVDTSMWSANTTLYLSDDGSGNLTSTVPEFPNYRVLIAFVVRSHANDGIIFVQPQIDYTDGVTLNSLYIRETLQQQGVFGQLYTHDNTVLQSFPNGTTYTKIETLNLTKTNRNVNVDTVNKNITITKTGIYRVEGSFSFRSATNNVIIYIVPFVNDIEIDDIHLVRKVATSGDIGNGGFTGFINISSVPSVIDTRLRHNNAGSVDITIEYGNFNIQYVGES